MIKIMESLVSRIESIYIIKMLFNFKMVNNLKPLHIKLFLSSKCLILMVNTFGQKSFKVKHIKVNHMLFLIIHYFHKYYLIQNRLFVVYFNMTLINFMVLNLIL